jgi:hypothetical protein
MVGLKCTYFTLEKIHSVVERKRGRELRVYAARGEFPIKGPDAHKGMTEKDLLRTLHTYH